MRTGSGPCETMGQTRHTHPRKGIGDVYKRQLIAEGLATPDGDERDAIYLKCEEMVAEKQPWMLISHSQNLLGVNPKVKDFYYHPTGVAFFKGVSKEA